MAHGLPDWYRGVDIAYQALAQLITRPTYGGAISTHTGKVVTPNAATTLLTVSGKGMLYGGYVWLDHTASQKDSKPMLLLDGQTVASETWELLNSYDFNDPCGYTFAIKKFDDVNFKYAGIFQYGLTFETSLYLYYYEAHGSNPTVYSRMVYALI